MLEQSAVHKTTTQGCGGDSPTAMPNNVFGWGRIDAYAAYEQATAPCNAPSAVTDLAIAELDAMQIKLTWTAKSGATAYNVSWNAAPYFTPSPACTSGTCTAVTTTSFTQAAPGDTTNNYGYVVQPKAACGAIQSTVSNRVGEFEFRLVR